MGLYFLFIHILNSAISGPGNPDQKGCRMASHRRAIIKICPMLIENPGNESCWGFIYLLNSANNLCVILGNLPVLLRQMHITTTRYPIQ